MPRDIVPAREGPRKEISTVLEPHNREWTPPRGGSGIHRPNHEGLKAMWEKAADELSKLQPARAVDLMRELPMGMLELYLLVEESNGKRQVILQSFPKPGHRARERYAAFLPRTTRRRSGKASTEKE